MAAALTLGLRGHRVVILEAAPKVCVIVALALGRASKIRFGLLTDDHE